MENAAELLDEAQLVIERLERISADSIWARRSSGHRGALLRLVESGSRDHGCLTPSDRLNLETLITAGYRFLERAARERLR